MRRKIWKSTQGTRSVTEFWLELVALWQELDLMTEETWDSPHDASRNKQNIENERVLLFLAGLNPEFDDVRGRILSAQVLPPTRAIYAEILREESRHEVMLPVSQSPASADSAVFVSQGTNYSSTSGKVTCDHRKKVGHTKDKCWAIYGKPADWKPKRGKPCANQTSQSQGSAPPPVPTMSKEQMGQLFEYFKTLHTEQQSTSAATVAHRGNHAVALHTFVPTKWIVDTGASDHMTSEVKMFDSYLPLAGGRSIQTATGSSSPIVGTGTVYLSDKLHLDSVLHVPHLSCNLLSISKLTKQLNCSAHFFPSYCVLQDLSSGMTIGTAKEYEGLYYLDVSTVSVLSCGISGLASTTNDNNIVLWHKRMGHPSFSYLQRMFPHLHLNKSTIPHCDICEFAKHHRPTFTPSIYKSTRPFSIIHSDVWGPCRIPNRTQSKYFVTFIDDHTRMCWVYLLKDKSAVTSTFIEFYHYVKTQFNTTLQVFYTDNGTEYFNQSLESFLKTNGIVHKSSCPYSP